MAAKIVNLANPDEDETLCATVEEARETLAAMIERFKSQGYRVDEQHSPFYQDHVLAMLNPTVLQWCASVGYM